MNRFVPILAVALVVACSDARAPLVASDVTINKPMPGMQMAAGYLTLTNNSPEPITITDVTSPQYGAVEMHETMIEDGISRMIELSEVTIEPSSSVAFEPGGKHLMLMRQKGEPDLVTLELHADETVVLTISVAPGD
ncbi:MAG: copper chaperone PCu(A)C [Woeseiaceae bacterium]|nr:copper chaperone PCu(A)C [Woeseiaceae bacterium]NIP22066.1 copper chaperone PCu(A)C [Woeseiaceae bacterium]NIS91180.1 copper chaperone PCu(A)C [Woeseiaceae bacterium]